jgi:hypothetical protein
MAIVRVEFRRTLRNADTVGKWDMYSSAYFEGPGSIPGLLVRNHIRDLFLGSGSGGYSLYNRTNAIVTGTNAGQIKCWEYTGGLLVQSFIGPCDIPVSDQNSSGDLSLPTQLSIAVGYRSDVPGPRQRGRSRWWAGPICCQYTALSEGPGGGRFIPAMVDAYANNASQKIATLSGLGWVLQVKTAAILGFTFSPAVELYVDDVPDVLRSRRTWQTYQKRLDL